MKITKFITVVVAILMGSSNLSAQSISYDGSLQYLECCGKIIVRHTVSHFPFSTSAVSIDIKFSSSTEITSILPVGSIMQHNYEWAPSGITSIISNNYYVYGTLTYDGSPTNPGDDIPIGDIIKRAIPNIGPRNYSEEYLLMGPVPDEVWSL